MSDGSAKRNLSFHRLRWVSLRSPILRGLASRDPSIRAFPCLRTVVFYVLVSFMPFVPTLTVAERIALILEGLGRAVAARIAPRGANGAMAAAMIVLVWTRVRRVEARILGLLARFQAGRLQVAVGKRAGRGGGGARVASARLPCGFAWLLPMVPCDAACFAGQLRTVLAEPELVALLDAAPQAARILGPLCRMLGIERSVLRVRATARPARAVETGASAAAPIVRARVRVGPAAVESWRIPLPRGVLSAARRAGFGKL